MIFNRSVEIIFNKEDQLILDGQSKICNWLYNHLLEMVKNDKVSGLLAGRNLRNEIPKLKVDKPFLRSVYSSPLKNVALRLKSTFKGFFNYEKGFPKYKSWKVKWFSLFYDEPNKGYRIKNNKEIQINLGIDEENRRLKVNGVLKEALHLKETDKIKNFRICKKQRKFYGIFCIERNNIQSPRLIRSYLSIDPNHKNFFVGINHKGESIEFEKITQTQYFDQVIDEIKSKRDKCKKGSKRWIRLNKAIDNTYHKRREQIKSMCYSVSNYIARNYDCVLIGDYTPSLETAQYDSMHRSMLNQTIIGKFRTILEWVMIRSGKQYKLVDEHETTKVCSICGHSEKKNPSIREFVCRNCGRHINRDINSSINIAKKGNILSGSDYVKWELSHVTYTAKWDYRKSRILFTGYASTKIA